MPNTGKVFKNVFGDIFGEMGDQAFTNPEMTGVTKGVEEASGPLVEGYQYEITATQADHFYVGCAIGDIFLATAAIVAAAGLDANNKVRKWEPEGWVVTYGAGARDESNTLLLCDSAGDAITNVSHDIATLKMTTDASAVISIAQVMEQGVEYYMAIDIDSLSGTAIFYNAVDAGLSIVNTPGQYSLYQTTKAGGFYALVALAWTSTTMVLDYFRAYKMLNN